MSRDDARWAQQHCRVGMHRNDVFYGANKGSSFLVTARSLICSCWLSSHCLSDRHIQINGYLISKMQHTEHCNRYNNYNLKNAMREGYADLFELDFERLNCSILPEILKNDIELQVQLKVKAFKSTSGWWWCAAFWVRCNMVRMRGGKCHYH